MSGGAGTMVLGNVLSANKSAPANERNFIERNKAVDAPRSFKEARTNMGILNDMFLKEKARKDLLDAYPKLKPLTFQGKLSSIVKTIQPAESTYSNTRSLLELNLELQKGIYTVPENMVLVLPVRFQNKTTGNFINIERFLTVNIFLGIS